MPVAHGMVGIYSAVASANHMAPWGGVEQNDFFNLGLIVTTTLSATELLAVAQGIDSIFVTGGLAAEETGTTLDRGPDPARLSALLAEARLSPLYAMSFLR